MPEIDAPQLTGGLIARKGDSGVTAFAADEVIRATSSGSRGVFGPAGIIVSLLIVATVSAYGGYRWGASGVRFQYPAADKPATVAARPEPASRAPARVLPAALPGKPPGTLPGALPSALPNAPPNAPPGAEPIDPAFEYAKRPPVAGLFAGLPPIPVEAVASLDKPVGTIAPPPHRAENWIDVSAILDGEVTPTAGLRSVRIPPRKPSRRASVYRIQLSALTSRAAANREWRRLKRSHGRLLADRDPIVIRGRARGGNRPVWRLQLAVPAVHSDARSFCRQARERRLGCMVIKP